MPVRDGGRLRAWIWLLLVPAAFLLLAPLLRDEVQRAAGGRAAAAQARDARDDDAAEAAAGAAARERALQDRHALAVDCIARARRATDASLWHGHLVLAVLTGRRCAAGCAEVEETARLANLYELDGLRALRIRVADPPANIDASSSGSLLREVVVPACAPLLEDFDPDHVLVDRAGRIADTGRAAARRRADGAAWSYRVEDPVRREVSGSP